MLLVRFRKFGKNNWDDYSKKSLANSERFLKMLPKWIGQPTNEFIDEKARRGIVFKTPTAYFEVVFEADSNRFFGFYSNSITMEEYDFLYMLTDHIPERLLKNLVFELLRHGITPPHSDSEALE